MSHAQSDAAKLAQVFCEGMRDEDRIDFALELLRSVSDTDLHHRVDAVANLIGQHGHKLAREHLPIMYTPPKSGAGLDQAMIRVHAEMAQTGNLS